MISSSLRRLYTFLARDGVIPGTAVISIIVTSNTARHYFENPISVTFTGLVFGGIGGGIIESLVPLPIRGFISGGILLGTGGNVVCRNMGWIKSPDDTKATITFNAN